MTARYFNTVSGLIFVVLIFSVAEEVEEVVVASVQSLILEEVQVSRGVRVVEAFVSDLHL